MSESLLATAQDTGGAEQKPDAAAPAGATPAGEGGDQAATPELVDYDIGGEKVKLQADWLKDGQPDVAAIIKALTARDAELTELRGKTAVPEAYTVSVTPEHARAIAAGGDLDKDPGFAAFTETAKKIGLTQTQYDAVLAFAGELASTQGEALAMKGDEVRAAELEALKGVYGAKTDGVLRELGAYAERLKAEHGDEVFQAVQTITSTAAGVRFLDLLRTGKIKPGTEGNLPGAGAQPAAPGVSDADLKSMMADPKYWRDKDPAFVAKVQEGFKRLYPER